MTRRWPTQAELLEAAGHLHDIAASWPATSARLTELHSGGHSKGRTDGPRSTTVSDPTAARALTTEKLDALIDRLTHTLELATGDIGLAKLLITGICGVAEPDPRPAASGAGPCVACERWVTGTAEDRLRAGLCPADYRRWKRAGMPERARFIRTLRADIRTGVTVRTGSPHAP